MSTHPMTRRGAITAFAMASGAMAAGAFPAGAQLDQTGGTTRFVRIAAGVSEFQIEAGRLALQRSRNTSVRGFAQRMVKDHSELITSLKFTNDSNASAPMPHGPAADGERALQELSATSDGDFDILYMDIQVRTLAYALDVYREYSRVGSVEGLKRYTVKNTPLIEQQVRMAQTVRGSMAG